MAHATATSAGRTRRICSVDGCGDAHHCRDYCCRHYQRFRKYGDPLAGGPLLRRTKRLPHSSSEEERFWVKVEKTAGCWLWLGAIGEQGYGIVITGSTWTGAHRKAWMHAGRALDPALTLDHLCHTQDLSCPGGAPCPHRRCVNPDHLEQVPRLENVMRGRGPTAINATKTHCKRGHEFTPQNTYRQPGRNGRYCRACGVLHVKAYLARKAAKFVS